MKKVLVALAMIMGLGTSVAFASVSGDTLAVEQTLQTPQDEFTQIAAKELPAAVINALAKDYEGASIKEAFVSERETGKVYKVIVTVIKEDQSTEDVTVLLNEKGEFLNAAEGAEVLRIAAAEDFEFADVDHLGKVIPNATYKQKHIESVLNLDLVDVEAIKAANFRVAIDCVNSVGGIVIPDLLYALGVKEIFKLHCAPHGNFSHNPEPIPENLTEISDLMGHAKADVGFVVDPDVDRLAIICENGEMFNEEYTLVAVSDYVLSHTPGNTVSNLSSSRALRDVTRAHGCEYNAAAVGEVNVVTKMKATNAVIGGEGNGGVIYPASHYGRDALVGIALFLTHLAKKKMKTSELKASYPPYFISKQKVQLTPEIDVDAILAKVKEKFSQYDITDIDGVKIDFPDKWVHLRKSNTEPIIRIYSEAHTMEEAEELGGQLIQIINEMCK